MPLDVQLDETGDLPHITRHISGVELTIQRVTIRLNLSLGEFLLDQTKGINYLAIVAQRPVDIEATGAIVRDQIETTPGVSRIDDFEASTAPSPDGVGLVLRFTGRVVVEDDDAQELVQLTVALNPVAGDTHPAVVTYHRLGAIAPHAPGFGGIT